jgi:hypothetical protein
VTLHRLHRPDSSQKPLVQALRDVGIQVWLIGRPCDLLLYFWCNRHHDFCWQTLEVKSPQKNGTQKKRYDQARQDEFLAATGTPVALDFDSAWAALNARHKLGRVEANGILHPFDPLPRSPS